MHHSRHEGDTGPLRQTDSDNFEVELTEGSHPQADVADRFVLDTAEVTCLASIEP